MALAEIGDTTRPSAARRRGTAGPGRKAGNRGQRVTIARERNSADELRSRRSGRNGSNDWLLRRVNPARTQTEPCSSSLRLNPQGPELSGQPLGPLHQLDVGGEPLVVGTVKVQLSRGDFRPHLEARADPAVHLADRIQSPAVAQPPAQLTGVGVPEVILLDSVTVVEAKLVREVSRTVSGRNDLKSHLRGDVPLQPLEVRPPVGLGPAEYHHDIRCDADRVVPLDRVPEQVAGDEDARVVPVERVQTALNRRDP